MDDAPANIGMKLRIPVNSSDKNHTLHRNSSPGGGWRWGFKGQFARARFGIDRYVGPPN